MKNVVYDFSSVLLDITEPLAGDMIEWGNENIPEEIIFKKAGFGREDEMHVTALYGLYSNSSKKTKQVMEKQFGFDVSLGKISIFDGKMDYDVVVVDVESEDLRELNETLKENLSYKNKYSEYRPHATIAYIQKHKGWNLCGISDFVGRTFSVNHIVFSSKDGSKERIPIH